MVFSVGLTYNLKQKVSENLGLPVDFFAEFDDEETVDAIYSAIKKAGCEVTKIEADQNAYGKLLDLKPEIVFNIAEGLHGEGREAQIPAILEMLKIPYTGSGPVTLAISLNKSLTHQILCANGVAAPKFIVYNNVNEINDVQLPFPLVVKPIAEGSGKGIRSNSLVRDFQSLKNQVAWVTENYHQPAIVEEFIEGREFTVGLIGNKKPFVLPIVEITFDKLPEGSNPLYAYEAKWIWDVPEKPLDIFVCPAKIPKSLETEIKDTAVKAFQALKCRDVCRMDIRLDKNGKPNVLDLNPLPGMIPDPDAHSCLPEAAMTAGYSYDQLICTILWQAILRNNLQDKCAETSIKQNSRLIR
ncbi:ATP-grasp domain-containing protein [Candidatus Bathyarchaeota archaeon]|nr:ATP-grasp domain-containing protein [Candidatus Bathyarchaeota archaeon]